MGVEDCRCTGRRWQGVGAYVREDPCRKVSFRRYLFSRNVKDEKEATV